MEPRPFNGMAASIRCVDKIILQLIGVVYTTVANMNKKETARLAQTFASDCIAFRVRALNRVITNLYDTALKPFGITVNQTTILAMLSLASRARPGGIGRELHMEKSTVSRNLERMRKNGWIASETAESGTARVVTVTPAGRELLADVYPEWEKAQATATRLLGDEGVNAVQTLHEAMRRMRRAIINLLEMASENRP
jgi:DNA-binding MarR family transcriptional regulator